VDVTPQQRPLEIVLMIKTNDGEDHLK
jgi:hypothetical protein